MTSVWANVKKPGPDVLHENSSKTWEGSAKTAELSKTSHSTTSTELSGTVTQSTTLIEFQSIVKRLEKACLRFDAGRATQKHTTAKNLLTQLNLFNL
jgi:ABC-type lipoprotein export system ATPase subunit